MAAFSKFRRHGLRWDARRRIFESEDGRGGGGDPQPVQEWDAWQIEHEVLREGNEWRTVSAENC